MFIRFDHEKRPVLFDNPLDLITCRSHDEMGACFDAIEKAVARECFVAGFLSYEAGYGFEDRLRSSKRYDFPLIYLGVFAKPRIEEGGIEPAVDQKRQIKLRRTNIGKSGYFNNIAKIREQILAGDVYQITYCIKYKFGFDGDPFSLYCQLKREQPVPYPAYIEADGFTIASLSPELFIKKEGQFVKTKPMKGTWRRGRNSREDAGAGLRLKYDPKNRAENIMIVDLMRNDLGRVGREIRAPKLFEVAKYATLYQMTSTVTALVDREIPFQDLFRAIFPSGSVTGAPKIRAMMTISELENEERRIYTGAIGYITPRRDLFFNIPIRTLLIKGKTGELGIGGGIVRDSTAQGEWDECRLKAKFVFG